MAENYTVLGVSAGNGVMLYPFKNRLQGNFEIRREYLIKGQPLQWALNFPDIPFYPSFTQKSRTAVSPFSIDVILGHPKCGNSSVFALSRGKAFTTRSDEPSLTLFMDSVKYYKPLAFCFENLPKLLETYSAKDIHDTLKGEYHIKALSVPVSFFGNSQASRVRLLVFGFLKSFKPINEEDLLPVHPHVLPKTEELLNNLPENGHITEDLDSVISLYGGFKISLREMQKFWKDNPMERHYKIEGGRMGSAPGVYINRIGDLPLTVRKTNRQFNPQGIQMSPRELARIQGIPDSFLILDPKIAKSIPKTTLINKGRFTVANTPPYEVALFIKEVLDKYFSS